MILEIKKHPDPILKKRALEIKELNEEVKSLAKDMIETMTEKDGVGLAGPQVGEGRRIVVVMTQEGPQVFLNPKIVSKSKEKELGEEGCLSLPDLFLKINRFKEVEVEALNLSGEKIKLQVKDFMARVFQHEIDHLDGILFIDRLSWRQKIWRRLNG
jgi:peptide deformylase